MATSKTTTPPRGISVELFEKINEAACVDLALGIEALDAVLAVAEDDTAIEHKLRHWYPVLALVRCRLEQAKERIETLSGEGYDHARK